jgi:hypothetical protein
MDIGTEEPVDGVHTAACYVRDGNRRFAQFVPAGYHGVRVDSERRRLLFGYEMRVVL